MITHLCKKDKKKKISIKGISDHLVKHSLFLFHKNIQLIRSLLETKDLIIFKLKVLIFNEKETL